MATKKRWRGTSFLLHGRPGAGKSTLLSTLPKPALIVDAESGDDDYGKRAVVLPWEEFRSEDYDPRMLTPKTLVVIDALEYHDYRQGIQFILSDHQRMFRGFGLDSITAIQDKMGKELLPLNRAKIAARHTNYDHFRTLLDYMYDDLERVHQLTKTRGLVTAWVCQTNRESSPMQPQLVGAMRQKILNIPDIVGFLRVEDGVDEDGNKERYRVLDIDAAEGSLAEAKCRRRKVAGYYGETFIPHPNLRTIARVASPVPKRRPTTKKDKDTTNG